METIIPGFNFRQEQLTLALGVASAFINDEFFVVEAGTGVGKTFAYLLPAILWSRHSQEKVVISTRTRALQQQIIDRDLPNLVQVMDIDFQYAEAQGRENFLCWNKYINILAGKVKLSAGQESFIQTILTWAETTDQGNRKELTLSSDKMKFWPLVAADRNHCRRESCRYQEKCFRLKMLRRLEKADLIITNHALLLSDLLVDNAILPAYDYLIIDEAHTFVRESFDKLSCRWSYRDLEDVLKIYRRESLGFLLGGPSENPQLRGLINGNPQLLEKALTLNQEFFIRVNEGLNQSEQSAYHHVINNHDIEQKWFAEAFDTYLDWQSILGLLLQKLRAIKKALPVDQEEGEMLGIINSLQEISDNAFIIMEENIEKEDKICWLEFEDSRAVALCSSEIHTGDIIDQALYQKLKGMVMVSATLAVNQSFASFITRSGLDTYEKEGRLVTLLENSPFDYDKQASLFVVNDMPDPGHYSFSQEVNRVLDSLLQHVGGQTMVLFTSRKQLEEASLYLKPRLSTKNLQLLVQYEDGEFGALVESFISQQNTVLMGLETFWEGVDLSGECLKFLVIVKLPFRSPTEPYCSAGERYFKMAGKNCFEFFMLPDATLRFKQGVGRLIRNEKDQGAIIVLDTRLLYRNYGRVIRNSLPFENLVSITKAEINRNLDLWR